MSEVARGEGALGKGKLSEVPKIGESVDERSKKVAAVSYCFGDCPEYCLSDYPAVSTRVLSRLYREMYK